MENRITITENAYFYNVVKPISKRQLETIIGVATDHRTGKFEYKNIRREVMLNGKSFKTTLAVFKYYSNPGFLMKGIEKETRYGYLLVVEFNNFLVISKKGTVDFSEHLEKNVSGLSYNTLAKFRVRRKSRFKRMSVSSLDTGRGHMRRSHYEADDIQEIISTVTTSSKVLSSLRVKNDLHETSIALNTSRINQLGKKTVLDYFCLWAGQICEEIETYIPEKCFVDNFAEPLIYADTICSLIPVSVLFDFYQLADDVSNGAISRIFYKSKYGAEKDISITALLDANDFCFALDAKGSKRNFNIINPFDHTLAIEMGPKDIQLYSEKLSRVKLEFSDGEIKSLLTYINKEHLFVVAFDNSEIRYASKGLFRDSKLFGNISYFLNYIHTTPELGLASSEKGKPVPHSTGFDPDSVFDVVEKELANDCDYLFCDDLGDEWADHIGFKKNSFIRFYHSKASSKTFSASAFHDLVSQALKNIGHFDFNKELTVKQAKMATYYAGTQINRMRKGGDAISCFSDLRQTYNSPNVQKEIYLVINFLSKADLALELERLLVGEAKNQTIQILWLLSSLICTCQEKGIKLKIITKP
jgi:hypothetical protein